MVLEVSALLTKFLFNFKAPEMRRLPTEIAGVHIGGKDQS